MATITDEAQAALRWGDEARIEDAFTRPPPPGLAVECTDGWAGRVMSINADMSGRLRTVAVRLGRIFHRLVDVPAGWVEGYNQKTLRLGVERRRLLALPDRRSNEETADAGHRAVLAAGILRTGNYSDVSVTLRAGVANLSGHVRTATDRLRADSAVREVPGVREVQNDLVADDDLVNQVAQALAHDERTRHETIFVAVSQGVVILSGLHNSSKARAAAEECAGQVSSVRGVSNYIEAPGTVVTKGHERVVQPLVGQEVFASDMSLGRVERVVIDPTSRRVVAAVVGGQLPSLQPANLRLRSYEMRTEDRRLVVSAADIAFVTPTEVQLNISGAAAAERDDFAPGGFVQPDRAWHPPYPFTAEECLWARS